MRAISLGMEPIPAGPASPIHLTLAICSTSTATRSWTWRVEDARDQGCKNVAEMIAGFGRADMLDGGLDGFKNLMVWYACEKVANEIEDAKESA